MESLLASPQHRVQVVTDHKNLIYFTITHILNRRQVRWSTFLADYDFEIVLVPNMVKLIPYLGVRDSKYDQQMRPTINSLQLIWVQMN